MKEDLKKHFKEVENKFLHTFSPHTSGFEVAVEIEDVAERRRKRFKDLADKFSPSYSLIVSLSNFDSEKKLKLILTDGENLQGMHYNSLRFLIEYHGKGKVSLFSIRDYYSYKGIKEPIDDYFEVIDFPSASEKISRFIEQALSVIKMEDVKSILATKDWLNVPIDTSTYK